MTETTGLLHTVIELPFFKKPRPGLNADIITDPHFETDLIKIESKQEASLLSDEKKRVQKILGNSLQSNSAEKSLHVPFSERVIKHMLLKQTSMKFMHIHLRFLIATSIICERLFHF